MKTVILTKEDVADEGIRAQIDRLYKQLHPNKDHVEWNSIFSGRNNAILVCCFSGDTIAGMASMGFYTVVSGRKGWIEDVVVDTQHRGQGIGRILIEKLLHVAEEENLTEVLLFTESHRTPAIRLYESLDFKKKDSMVYVLKR